MRGGLSGERVPGWSDGAGDDAPDFLGQLLDGGAAYSGAYSYVR